MYYKFKRSISIFMSINILIIYAIVISSIIAKKSGKECLAEVINSKTQYSNSNTNSNTNTNSNNNEVNKNELIIDAHDHMKVIPKNFRTTSDLALIKTIKAVNINGMDMLNISGSEQFSAYNLFLLKKSFGEKVPIIMIDLRQESHGFVNQYAVSWQNEKNDSNIGLTRQQILLKQRSQLNNIKIGDTVKFNNHAEFNSIVRTVECERSLLQRNDLGYIYIPVTDGKLPLDDMVDYFVSSSNSNCDAHLHFHCKYGIGRTTTFMIMYDMMKNYKVASADEIINRQLSLANFDDDTIHSFYSKDRVDFLKKFYQYCAQSSDNFKTTWSQWLKTM